MKFKKELEKEIKAIYIKLHPRDPKVAQKLLDFHFESCVAKLKEANIVIFTKQGPNLKEK